MTSRRFWTCLALSVLVFSQTPSRAQVVNPDASAHWTQAGWGGGGFYYAAAFHPTKDGVIYQSGDVNGVYKTEDHGQHWRIINNGIADYGVFTLAVDPKNPDTVFAATEGGLCKSIDAGEHWIIIPETGKKELRITGEKNRSVRCIAVDPSDSNNVFAASPNGKIYKSQDGGQTWAVAYEKKPDAELADTVRVQFGKNNGAIFGGIWMPLKFPETIAAADAVGIGFSFKPEGVPPRDMFLNLKTSTGITYRSKNLADLFNGKEMIDVVLTSADFVLDPEWKGKNKDKVDSSPATPEWSTVNRIDLACVGGIDVNAAVGKFTKFFFAATRTIDGQTGTAEKPVLVTVRDFVKDKALQSYGNLKIGAPGAGPALSVAVSPKDSALVIAATADTGLLISNDSGQTWRQVDGPKRASSVAFAASDPNTLYAACSSDGVWKSVDKGQTWANSSTGLEEGGAIRDLCVSPTNPQDVYAIGNKGWGGRFYYSNDGGQTWNQVARLTPDTANDPTLDNETAGAKAVPLSIATNLVINPSNPKELFISANWRSAISSDAGLTWVERAAGTDISCITDVRFHKDRTYVSVMDEGVLSSDNNGTSWKQHWPLRHTETLSGHYWRLAIDTIDGAERIISTSSPWVDKNNNQIVLSHDGGATFKISKQGLPNYLPTPNTMWGRGYARGLAVDPKNPMTVYTAIDGDPSDGKSGGGIFKSIDGGETWKQLPNQPGSRRMYYGLAVDPTDSNRIFFGTCGVGGGLYRSDDAGDSWKLVFHNETWIFNVAIGFDGTVYCPGNNLWRSTDHGDTWKQISKFPVKGSIVGLEPHPSDAKTIWASVTTWDGASNGGVFKTTDGGETWQDITGDLPYRKPQILRYNAATNELWAAGVGLYRLKQ